MVYISISFKVFEIIRGPLTYKPRCFSYYSLTKIILKLYVEIKQTRTTPTKPWFCLFLPNCKLTFYVWCRRLSFFLSCSFEIILHRALFVDPIKFAAARSTGFQIRQQYLTFWTRYMYILPEYIHALSRLDRQQTGRTGRKYLFRFVCPANLKEILSIRLRS